MFALRFLGYIMSKSAKESSSLFVDALASEFRCRPVRFLYPVLTWPSLRYKTILMVVNLVLPYNILKNSAEMIICSRFKIAGNKEKDGRTRHGKADLEAEDCWDGAAVMEWGVGFSKDPQLRPCSASSTAWWYSAIHSCLAAMATLREMPDADCLCS